MPGQNYLYKVDQRDLEDLRDSVETVTGNMIGYERQTEAQNLVRMQKFQKEILKNLKEMKRLLKAMKQTTEDDEMYVALTKVRNDLIQEFSTKFFAVQNQKLVEYRSDCIGMLNFVEVYLAKKYKMP